jgi:ribosomal protein L28
MDPMKKDRKERVFLLSISPSLMKLRTSSSTTKSLSMRVYAKGLRVLRKRILRRVCGGNTKGVDWLLDFYEKKKQELVTWQSYRVDQHSSGT